MNKIIDYLRQLDLSEVEAKLYLTLLKSGPISVRELAETIEIKRTTAYLYIDQLVEKGLVIKFVKGSHKQVAANKPDSLQYLVEKKLEVAKSLQKNFPDIVKTITTNLPQSTDIEDSEIKSYKGNNGVKKIYEDALKAKELRSYVNLEILREAFPENEFLFLHALTVNKEIKIYEIFEHTPQVKELITGFQKTHNRFFYKFLPSDVKLSAVDILIYDGKVAIISVYKQISGVVFQNREYYDNSKELFDLVWQLLPA